MRRLNLLPLVLLAACAEAPLAPTTNPPMSVAAERGQAIARANCAACHAIWDAETSPNPASPTFSTIRLRHNALSLERQLSTISREGHLEMPRRTFSSGDIEDLIAYIELDRSRP